MNDNSANHTGRQYDAIAVEYDQEFATELAEKIWDRKIVDGFIELCHAWPQGTDHIRVADLGCGAGRLSEYLMRHGLYTVGIDASAAMISLARERNPDAEFVIGTIANTGFPDHYFIGVVAYYSIIHTPADQLYALFSEISRIIIPGGIIFMAFQCYKRDDRENDSDRTDSLYLASAFDKEIDLEFLCHDPSVVQNILLELDFRVIFSAVRSRESKERSDHAYLICTRD